MKVHSKAEFHKAIPTGKIPRCIQLAALCRRKGDDGVEVLLVTSSNDNWILPKGWPMEGKKNSEAAMIEAWEEAGVRRGKVSRKPIGSFETTKTVAGRIEAPCEVKVFEVKVAQTVKKYPEVEDRDRRWVSIKKARKLVEDQGLRGFLKDYAKSL